MVKPKGLLYFDNEISVPQMNVKKETAHIGGSYNSALDAVFFFTFIGCGYKHAINAYDCRIDAIAMSFTIKLCSSINKRLEY